MHQGMTRSKRLAILVNIISPYRLPIYRSLAEKFDTLVLHGGKESNRWWQVDIPTTLKARSVWTIKIPMRKRTGVAGVSDTSYVHINLGLIRWLIRFRPEIVLSNEMGLRTVFAVLYGKVFGAQVWVWWGGTVHSERNITKARAYLRKALTRHIKNWISYGATSTEYLESLGVRRDRILQIQNCVPHETFLVEPSHLIDWFKQYPKPVILTVGQLIERKGIDKLIEACGRLAARGIDFTLVVVGQGPERERLAGMAAQAGIKHFYIFENQSQQVLNEIYRAADVFVFPTMEDVWGLVANEAMWAGTPVLCSQYAGCAPELLPEGNIFDPLSAESFDAALAKVIDRSVCPPDQSRLKTWQEVSEMIRRSLLSDSAT
jgi:glycosyltransferase involved in cell wall biosynthesis